MGDILGLGLSHYPAALVPDEYRGWPLARFLRGWLENRLRRH